MWPRPPWCIGSVFPASQLLTAAESSSQPLFFEPCNAPHCVLKTGCSLYHTISCGEVDLKYQVKDIIASCIGDFCPEEPLIKTLEEDKKMTRTAKYLTGNCLEGIQDMEGQVQLFFPVGSNCDKIGTCRYNSSFHDSVTPEQKGHEETPLFSSSVSFHQPIVQITADKNASWNETPNDFLAVRTLYQVHWLTSRMEEDHVCFNRTGFRTFRYGTSHVSWNPHIPGEASVLLENGELSIFDLKSLGFDNPCTTVNMEEYIGHEASARFDETIPDDTEKKKKQKRKQKVLYADEQIPFSGKWTLEYAWHPKNLIVAGNKEICLVDLRQKNGSQKFCFCIACSCCSSGLSSYCNQQRKSDFFTALTRADYDGMFQFAAASSNHLLLYDIRQPKTILLQWEHRMQQEPPNYLQMHRVSDLCSSSPQGFVSPIARGRVILAYSYKSGNVHAFFYGPDTSIEPSFGNISSVKNDEQRETGCKFYSWELPIKLNNTKVGNGENIEKIFEASRINFEFCTPERHDGESMYGVFNFSPCQGSQHFTMLQLTKEGYIISQNYQVSEKLDRMVYQREPNFGRPPISRGYTGRKRYQLENMPAFLNYIRQGSVPPHIQMTSSNNGHHVTNKLEANYQNKMKTLDDQEKDLQQITILSDLDIELCPIKLPFKPYDDMVSTDTEQGILMELKGQLRQWQMDFQPFVAYCKSSGSDS